VDGSSSDSPERAQEMENFGSVTLTLRTELPTETDADIEARYEEFCDLRDKIEALFDQTVNLVPAGWKVTVDDE